MPWDRARVEELKPEISRLIDRLADGMRRFATIAELPEELPRPRPPASPADLARYEGYLELSLPSSYRAFLELHDGYDFLVPTGPMLWTTAAQPGGEFFERIRDWKTTTAEYGSGEVLDGIVIAYHGQPNSWTYLDPNQPRDDGELAIVKFSPEMSVDFPDIMSFLAHCIEIVDLSIEQFSS